MDLDKLWLTAPCPLCGYEFDLRFQQVRLQERVFCSCCKGEIQLIDDRAGAERARRTLADALGTTLSVRLNL